MATERRTTEKPRKVVGRPFEKGNRANPGGRPKTEPIVSALKAALQVPAANGDGTNLQVGVAKLMQQWCAGDPHAQKLVLAYVEGMPRQTIDLRGEAQKIAEQYGLDVDDLIREAEEIVTSARENDR